MSILIKNVLTVTMNQRNDIGYFSIGIQNDRFSEITDGAVRENYKTIIDGSWMIALPGLINGHLHSDVTLARGLGDGLSLYEQDYRSFVSRRRWFRDDLTREARFIGRILQYLEAIKGGTTFLCDVPFWHSNDDLILPLKMAGIDAGVVLDYREDFIKGNPIEKKNYFDRLALLRDNGYIPIIEAPSEEEFEPDLLKMLARWSDELDVPIHLHLAETRWRISRIRKLYGKTPVKYLFDLGFLSSRVIGSHAVYITTEELRLLSEKGVRIVNCPTSEMKISDGIAPVSRMVSQGIPVGVGTDGALWNDSSDLFSEIKQLMLLQRVRYGVHSFSSYDSLYAATLGGAKVFGLDDELGSIEIGKRANLILISHRSPHLVPIYKGKLSNIVQTIVACARAADVDTVIIGGNPVMQGKKFLRFNENEIIERAQQLGKGIFSSINV